MQTRGSLWAGCHEPHGLPMGAWQPGAVSLPQPGAGQAGGQLRTDRVSRKIHSDEICLRTSWELKSVGPS